MPNISKPVDMSSIWASAGNSVAPSAAKIAHGWVVALPPYQTANFIANKHIHYFSNDKEGKLLNKIGWIKFRKLKMDILI